MPRGCPSLKHTGVKVAVHANSLAHIPSSLQQQWPRTSEKQHMCDREVQFSLWFVTEGNGNIKPAVELVTGVSFYHLDKLHWLQDLPG